jgi:RNA polymerase sigma-70 factor (ECF subfamily)
MNATSTTTAASSDEAMSLHTNQDRLLALIENHKGILYKVANAYCRDPDDRNDLIQEIILQLWLSFKRFDERNKFSTWMYRVALNVAISFYRSERRRVRDAVPIEEQGLEIAVADRMLEDAGDDIRTLYQMIGRLDELNRALILLTLDGYSHDEIAAIVGITSTNVATRINRIKQKWQRELASSSAREEQS